MKDLSPYALVLTVLFFTGFNTTSDHWITEEHHPYALMFTSSDANTKQTYTRYLSKGVASTEDFFFALFTRKFDVYVHPHRASLDSTWRKDWNMPDFRSECWMVASGVSTKLDLLSPQTWDKEACDHRIADTIATQQLIAHEIVHVYHGQHNASPDFSDTEGIDWFVEGLATYASGQCDAKRLAEVKQALADNKAPSKLDDFWKGNLKYGFSGSMVKYINTHYGKKTLLKLLPFNRKQQILQTLNTTEEDLLQGWSAFVKNL